MQDQDYIVTVGALMLGVAIATGIASIMGTYYSSWVSTLFAKNLRQRLFAHTQRLSYQDYRHFNTSSLITHATNTNDVEQLHSTTGMVFEMLLPAPFVVVFGLILSWRSDPYMALILLIVSAILWLVFGIMVRKVLPMFAKVQKGLDAVNERVSQYVSGIRVIRAFNRTKLETARMNDSFAHVLEYRRYLTNRQVRDMTGDERRDLRANRRDHRRDIRNAHWQSLSGGGRQFAEQGGQILYITYRLNNGDLVFIRYALPAAFALAVGMLPG